MTSNRYKDLDKQKQNSLPTDLLYKKYSGNFSADRRNMIWERNLDQHKEMKSSENKINEVKMKFISSKI